MKSNFMLWGNEVLRLLDFSFPLHATIIHKVHGLTLDEIVFDMKGKHFSAGQAYVASVVESARTLQGLHILNFNLAAIRKSLKVESEMERLVNKCVQVFHNLFHYSITIPIYPHTHLFAILFFFAIMVKSCFLSIDDN